MFDSDDLVDRADLLRRLVRAALAQGARTQSMTSLLVVSYSKLEEALQTGAAQILRSACLQAEAALTLWRDHTRDDLPEGA